MIKALARRILGLPHDLESLVLPLRSDDNEPIIVWGQPEHLDQLMRALVLPPPRKTDWAVIFGRTPSPPSE